MENVYFLGIGGIGMSAIARYLKHEGCRVMGYDRTPSPLTRQLEKEGMFINYEDTLENVPQKIDYCIYTPAIPSDSIQFNEIKRRNIPLKKRAVALGEITRNKKVLAVAGTHGKTSTCGMIAHILSSSPLGCSAFLGGILKGIDSNFIYSKSPYVVAEADEYDRSFHQLFPYASVITAVDPDHMDIYHTYDNLHEAFVKYALQTDRNGLLLVKNDRKRLINDINKDRNCLTYSLTDTDAESFVSNIRIENGDYVFDWHNRGEVIKDMRMAYPGRHNIENAVAALTVCDFILKEEKIIPKERENILKEGLYSFPGIKRRLDYWLKTDRTVFIDDYAHHPNEIAASMHSLRELYPNRHFTGIFQPHLYTRTRDLADDFARVLEQFDTVILLPIYPARELPIEGVSSRMLLDKINNRNKYLVEKEELYPLLKQLKPELLVSFGAGDIDRMLDKIKETVSQL